MLCPTQSPSRGTPSIEVSLVIQEPNVVGYLNQFESEEQRNKLLEALKVGVIAIQSASPTLDTQVVQEKFGEVEQEMKSQMRLHQQVE